MAWQPDPLLLELFASVHRDLASALEAQQRLTDAASDVETVQLTAAQTRKIDRLKAVMAALRGALERRNSVVVH